MMGWRDGVGLGVESQDLDLGARSSMISFRPAWRQAGFGDNQVEVPGDFNHPELGA